MRFLEQKPARFRTRLELYILWQRNHFVLFSYLFLASVHWPLHAVEIGF
jgi:hypothetical protein